MAYPFSAAPTAFVLGLGHGRERYACCAVDALGIAPMLAQCVRIRSKCHHCGEALALVVDPAGPREAAPGVMVSIGRWREEGG